MLAFLISIHVVVCIVLVLVVLLQAGKGAEISATFGGSSQTVFGASGGADFFTKFTAITAILFMVNSIILTLNWNSKKKSVFDTTAPISQPLSKKPTRSTKKSVPQKNKPAIPNKK